MSSRTRTLGRLTFVITAVLSICGAGRTASVFADEFLVEAMASVLEAANGLENQSDYGYDVNGHICILGAFVSPGQSVSLERHFDVGRRYAVLAGGDRDARDVDIEIIDPLGNLVTADTESDPSPAVTFYSNMKGTYEVRIRLYAAAQASFIFVAILSEGGYHVPEENQFDAAVQLLGNYQRFADNGNASMLSTRGNFAVYGSIVAGGEDTTVDNVDFGHGQRIVLTGSDMARSDLDLYVLNNFTEQVQLSDVLKDSVPIVDATFYGGLYRLRLTNALPNGPSTFVLTGIVELH